MTLRPATAADFAFIRALAQRPENAPFITDEDETALQGYLDSPDAALVIWQAEGAQPDGEDGGEPEGIHGQPAEFSHGVGLSYP